MFLLICLIVCAVSFQLFVPSRTQEMLREWEAENGVEIIKGIRLNHPWTMKWGVFSQSQRFVRVLVRDTTTDAHTEMVLCLGGLFFGLKTKHVRICERRPLATEGAGSPASEKTPNSS